ncbi:gluconokinase [Tessaracoccus bendigoensis DSM 12906]|uniref:Gluconokinase n=1 Tax=Tessaracoccus bendigoensis DSM 12906 TaxID=1123357 RepID=A0A1M6JS35_9ACTN|nr:gluconokinase [Tessaracoccus bendigoensis]SHJ49555.1 gluconokinase [Tessaracoccus bendigoensis DSM 12906]
MTNTHLVVMGVAGCGKSTVAGALHDRLGWKMAEGDDLHPAENIAKMSSGVPLTDEDRWPWLRLIVDWTATQDDAGNSTIVTCSALRRVYRDRLRAAPGRTLFVHLAGSQELLAGRLASRTEHFMPASLLPSQFATLEPLEDDEDGFTVDLALPVHEIADLVLSHLGNHSHAEPTEV